MSHDSHHKAKDANTSVHCVCLLLSHLKFAAWVRLRSLSGLLLNLPRCLSHRPGRHFIESICEYLLFLYSLCWRNGQQCLLMHAFFVHARPNPLVCAVMPIRAPGDVRPPAPESRVAPKSSGSASYTYVGPKGSVLYTEVNGQPHSTLERRHLSCQRLPRLQDSSLNFQISNQTIATRVIAVWVPTAVDTSFAQDDLPSACSPISRRI